MKNKLVVYWRSYYGRISKSQTKWVSKKAHMIWFKVDDIKPEIEVLPDGSVVEWYGQIGYLTGTEPNLELQSAKGG